MRSRHAPNRSLAATLAIMIVIAAPIAAAPLSAQQPATRAPLDSGAVVRITWASGDRVSATLLAPPTDSLRFCRYPSPECATPLNPAQTAPLVAVRAIEVPRGHRTWHGALRGAEIGFGLGLVVGVLGGAYAADGHMTNLPGTVAGMTLTGALWGALIGSHLDHWVPAP